MTRARRLNCESAPVAKTARCSRDVINVAMGSGEIALSQGRRGPQSGNPRRPAFVDAVAGRASWKVRSTLTRFLSVRLTSRRAKRRNYFGERFSGRPLSMLESAAFSVLNLAEHKMLLRIEIEAGRHAGNDNGKWPVTFEQFKDYGIRRALIAPSRRALVALGLIVFTPGDCERRG